MKPAANNPPHRRCVGSSSEPAGVPFSSPFEAQATILLLRRDCERVNRPVARLQGRSEIECQARFVHTLE